jgi:hypothetical protein
MGKTIVASAAIAVLLLLAASASRTAAAPIQRHNGHAGFAQRTPLTCGTPTNGSWTCLRAYPPRQYWQWGWEEPPGPQWAPGPPNILGFVDPPLVPADVWARQWHPPWIRHWGWHHRHRL